MAITFKVKLHDQKISVLILVLGTIVDYMYILPMSTCRLTQLTLLQYVYLKPFSGLKDWTLLVMLLNYNYLNKLL